MEPVTGIHRRPLDLVLVVFFVLSILYGTLFSLPEGFGAAVAADSPWPPLRWLHAWAVTYEPAQLDPSPVLITNCLFDGLVGSPLLVFVIWGLVRLPSWLPPLALFYSGAAATNMVFYFAQTFFGPHPPLHLGVYLPLNLPWLIAPLVLAARVLPLALGSDPAVAMIRAERENAG